MIVCDASAVLEILVRSAKGRTVADRLFRSGDSLHVPEIFDLEVVQVLRRLERQERLSRSRATEAFRDLEAVPIRRHSHEPLLPRVWELRARVTAYDAAYVALAEGLRATLVTLDRGWASLGLEVAVEVF